MTKKFRYPGTKSFSTEEEDVFFGRDEDIHNLLTSILINPTTVLFGYSGTGKSSIIRAGLLPQLYRRLASAASGSESYHVIQVSPKPWVEGKRLWQEIRKGVIPWLNLAHPFLPEDDSTPPASLWHLLKKDQYNQEMDEYRQTTLFIFDQAEELFTYSDSDVDEFVNELHPVIGQFIPEAFRRRSGEGSDAGENEIFLRHGNTLYAPLQVKFLFSIRSDKLHLVTRLKKASNLILQNSFELLALSRDQAFAGMRRPAKKSGDFASDKFTITDPAASSIFRQLGSADGTPGYNPEETRIDPFSLQIICSFIERQLVMQDGIRDVTEDHLGDLKAVINGYYEDAIDSLTFTNGPLTDTEKDRVRDFLELRMIVDNRRIPIPDVLILSDIQYSIMTNELLDQLVEKRILKRDAIQRGYLYEITHDSFIRPMLEARARRVNLQPVAEKTLPQVGEEWLKAIRHKWSTYRKKEARSTRISLTKNAEPGKKAELTDMMPPASARQDMELYPLYKKLGEAYFVNKDYDEAIQWLGLAAEIPQTTDSTFLIEIYKGRSDAYFYTGKYGESIEDLKTVLGLAPGDRQALNYLIQTYDLDNKFGEGIDWMREQKLINDDSLSVLTDIGFKFIDTAEYDKAEKYFIATLQYIQTDYNALRGMGMVQAFRNQLDGAKHYFETALAIDPQNPQPYSDIGYTYYLISDHISAIEFYKKALAIKSDYPEAIVGLSRSYFEMGGPDNLRLAHKAYLRLSTSDTPAENYHYNLGIIEEGLEDYEHAVGNFRLTILNNAGFEEAHTHLTDLYIAHDRADKLEPLYRGLVSENPEYAKFYLVYLGLAFEKQRRFDKAIELYQEAITIDDKFVHPHYRLGDLYRDADRPEAAIGEYKKALEVDPANSYFLCALGYVYRYLGNYEEAILSFEQAIKLSPDTGWYYVGLGGVYFRKMDYDKAINFYEDALKQNDAHLLARASLAACYREKKLEKECAEHRALVQKQLTEDPNIQIGTYDRSCVEALCGNREEAMRLLKLALDNKEIYQRYVQRDSDFYLYQNDPDFMQLVGLMAALPDKTSILTK